MQREPKRYFVAYSFLGLLITWFHPGVICTCWAFDADVRYWLGLAWPWVAVLIVFWVVLLANQLHRHKRPHKWTLIILMIGTCVTYCGIGGDYMTKSNLAAAQLLSSDCSHLFQEKHELHKAYIAAREIFQACQKNKTLDRFVASVEDCPGYDESSPHFDRWLYLKSAEARYGCVGFCVEELERPGLWFPAMWTRDPCDDAIGRKMRALYNTSVLILGYALGAFFLFVVWIITVNPSLRKYIDMH